MSKINKLLLALCLISTNAFADDLNSVHQFAKMIAGKHELIETRTGADCARLSRCLLYTSPSPRD